MLVVHLSSREPDYLAACTFRGLNEVLGVSNVLDATWAYYLHADMKRPDGYGGNEACEAIGQFPGSDRISTRWAWQHQKCKSDVDLVVIHYSAWKDDRGWSTVEQVLDKINPGYRMAYVCGDDFQGPYPDPPVPATVRFQRELSPGSTNATQPQLCFSAPEDWACASMDRPIGFIFAGHLCNDKRRAIAKAMPLIASMYSTVLATGIRSIPWPKYMDLLRLSRACFCPPGAADCKDTMRRYEAMASGAYPLTGEETMEEAMGLVRHADHEQIVADFLRFHSTRARAQELLTACGFTRSDWMKP